MRTRELFKIQIIYGTIVLDHVKFLFLSSMKLQTRLSRNYLFRYDTHNLSISTGPSTYTGVFFIYFSPIYSHSEIPILTIFEKLQNIIKSCQQFFSSDSRYFMNKQFFNLYLVHTIATLF